MKRFMNAAIPILLFLYSCAHTKITSVVDPDFRNASYSKVLIISTFSDLLYKEIIEKSFENSFLDNKILSIAGSNILPPTREYSNEEISAILKSNGIDGILVLGLEDYWESIGYVPQSSTVQGSAYIVGNSIQYAQQKKNYGGFYLSKPRVIFESRLFDAKTGNLVWRSSSLTRGNAFANFSTLANSLSESTVDKLLKDRILKPKLFSQSTIKDSSLEPISEESIQKKLEEAGFMYKQHKYKDVILLLEFLEQRINKTENIKNVNSYLAELYFLRGACHFVGWNNKNVASAYFLKTKNYNPGFQVDSWKFSKSLEKAFIELQEFPTTINHVETGESQDSIIEKQNQSIIETFPKGTQVRVIKNNAVLRVESSHESLIIQELPLGAILNVKEKIDEWLKIELPPNKDGFVIVGFIHLSFVTLDQ
jgi:hypothetical protein